MLWMKPIYNGFWDSDVPLYAGLENMKCVIQHRAPRLQ